MKVYLMIQIFTSIVADSLLQEAVAMVPGDKQIH